uniref:Uncharacterized protein n=1 Tax=Aegilops tauschii subsp. strangulata TaxID=200361 RepID=A0A452YM36_AEGTS
MASYQLLPRQLPKPKLHLQPHAPSEAIEVSKVTPPRRKRCQRHRRHPIRHSQILGFHPKTIRHEMSRNSKVHGDTFRKDNDIHGGRCRRHRQRQC